MTLNANYRAIRGKPGRITPSGSSQRLSARFRLTPSRRKQPALQYCDRCRQPFYARPTRPHTPAYCVSCMRRPSQPLTPSETRGLWRTITGG